MTADTEATDRNEPVALMEPLLIGADSRRRAALTDLALDLTRKSAGFRRSLSPSLLASLADLVRAMNCYYSNLIEGHDTHPVDIERALKIDYSHTRFFLEVSIAQVDFMESLVQPIACAPASCCGRKRKSVLVTCPLSRPASLKQCSIVESCSAATPGQQSAPASGKAAALSRPWSTEECSHPRARTRRCVWYFPLPWQHAGCLGCSRKRLTRRLALSLTALARGQ